jgi:hypothetical protein
VEISLPGVDEVKWHDNKPMAKPKKAPRKGALSSRPKAEIFSWFHRAGSGWEGGRRDFAFSAALGSLKTSLAREIPPVPHFWTAGKCCADGENAEAW